MLFGNIMLFKQINNLLKQIGISVHICLLYLTTSTTLDYYCKINVNKLRAKPNNNLAKLYKKHYISKANVHICHNYMIHVINPSPAKGEIKHLDSFFSTVALEAFGTKLKFDLPTTFGTDHFSTEMIRSNKIRARTYFLVFIRYLHNLASAFCILDSV